MHIIKNIDCRFPCSSYYVGKIKNTVYFNTHSDIFSYNTKTNKLSILKRPKDIIARSSGSDNRNYLENVKIVNKKGSVYIRWDVVDSADKILASKQRKIT